MQSLPNINPSKRRIPDPPKPPEHGIVTEEGWSRGEALAMAGQGEMNRTEETMNDRLIRWKSEMSNWSYEKLNKFLQQCEANVNKPGLALFKDDISVAEIDAINVLGERTFRLLKEKKMPEGQKNYAKQAINLAEKILSSQLKAINLEIKKAEEQGKGTVRLAEKKNIYTELFDKITMLTQAL